MLEALGRDVTELFRRHQGARGGPDTSRTSGPRARREKRGNGTDGVESEQVAIFYLILRGLDTIEDDMTIDIDTKLALLESFHLKLEQDGWNFTECQSRRGWSYVGKGTTWLTGVFTSRSWAERKGPAPPRRLPGCHRRVQALGGQVSYKRT